MLLFLGIAVNEKDGVIHGDTHLQNGGNALGYEGNLAQAEVRKTYKVSRVGTIAGCMVTEGKVVRECGVRLIRNGIVIYTGKLGSLKRFENDAKEVLSGYECGMTIENFNDIKEGDIIEAFEMRRVRENY